MFSKTELDFLKGNLQVSETYARILHHRINKKVVSLREVIPLLTERGYQIPYVTENCNGVTEFSNASQETFATNQSEHTLKNTFFSLNTSENSIFSGRTSGSPEEIRTPVAGSKAPYA